MSENSVDTPSFGSLLKKIRQDKSLSLEEVCSDLKINLKLLRNLENSNLEELPKRAFTRGLIKSYAKYLKHDNEDILNLYDANFESNSHIVKTGVLKKSDDHETVFISDVFQKTVLPVLILFLTVAGVLAVALFLKGYNPSSTFNQVNNTNSNDLNAPVVANGSAKHVVNNNKVDNTDEDKEVDALKEAEALVPVKEQALKVNTLIVEPLDKTALMIKTNLDKTAVKARLKPNKTRVFKFESAEIKYFDAGAVNVLFNGENIGVPGKFGEQKVVRYPAEITR